MERVDIIRNWLDEQEPCDVIECWNHYQIENCYEEDVYPMDELHEFICDMDPGRIVEEFNQNDDFNYMHMWFYRSIYGYRSFDELDDDNCPVYLDDLASWIDRTEDDCGYQELEDILNDKKEDEDE